MRFKEYLTELSFSKAVDIDVIRNKYFSFRTTFTVDGVNYLFAASLTPRVPDQWEIVFVPRDADADEALMAGKIDAFKVFSAVNKSLEMFINKYNPRVFKFSGAGPKLDKLYKTLAPKLAKKFSNYEYSYNTKWSEHYFTKKSKIQELSMSKRTNIEYIKRSNMELFAAYITLEDGQLYEIWARRHLMERDQLKSNYGIITDLPYVYKWEVFFTDVNRNIETTAKPTGTSLELFAAIETYFKKFLDVHNPLIITFSSSQIERSKLKLYTHLAKRIAAGAGYFHREKAGQQILIKKEVVKGIKVRKILFYDT